MLNTPTIKEIQTNIIGDIEAALGQSIPILAKAVFRLLAYALAGVWIILYKFGSDAFKQRFVQTANEQYLMMLGEIKKVPRKSANTWEGTASIIATGSSGIIEAGTQFIFSDTGIVYLTESNVPITPGTLTLNLIAGTSGDIGNLEATDVLDIVSPKSGIATIAIVTGVTTQGEDKEDLEVYRQRVLDVYQKNPQGGASADYERWGKEAPHVLAIYPYSSATPGYMDVYVEVDNQPDGIPTTIQLDTVEDYITYDPVTGKQNRKPTTAGLNMHGITRHPFNLTINGLSPDTPDNRAAINAAVDDYMTGKEPYIRGLTIVRNDAVTKMDLIALIRSVLETLNANFSNMTLFDGSESIDLYAMGRGEKAKRGTTIYA